MTKAFNVKITNSYHANARDILHGEFDLTWMRDERYKDQRSFTHLPIENGPDDGEVLYEYNSDSFRCDEFTKIHEKGKHFLFGGCSQTEGVGSPLDTVWTKKLFDHLNLQGRADGFYSIAKSGFGFEKIIANFLVYKDKYGLPDYFIVLMPNIGRLFEWDEHLETWFYVQRYPWATQDNDIKDRNFKVNENIKEKQLTIQEHRRLFLQFKLQWGLFEQYCKSNNVNLIWSTWDYPEKNNFIKFKPFNSYIDLSYEGYLQYIKKARPDGVMNKNDIWRRDNHDGILAHEYWAENFQKAIDG